MWVYVGLDKDVSELLQRSELQVVHIIHDAEVHICLWSGQMVF